jgi:hypothetical protein
LPLTALRERRGQQRFQRLPLALAGGGVHHQVGADERGQGQQDRQQHRQDHAALGFGTGQVLAATSSGRATCASMPRHQAQRTDLAVVGGQRRLQACG